MGKASMCIKLLQILSTGRVYQISELADLLDTNPRNIIAYKKEIDCLSDDHDYNCGFLIKTVYGRYGGYQLNGEASIPSLQLTESEKSSLRFGLEFLSKRNDFLEKKEFTEAMGKIFSSLSHNENNDENLLIINRFPLVMDEKELHYRSLEIKKAITEKKKINLTYLSSKNVEKKHLFDPYELFVFNNSWFVIGWLNSLDHPGICWFKLNRIKEIEITNKSFRVMRDYNRYNYLDDFGFKANGEWHHIEFIAHGTYASLVKERKYGRNQVVTPIDENSTKVSVDMQNEENIRVFVLGFGENIDVLEPAWLKKDLISIAETIKKKYSKR